MVGLPEGDARARAGPQGWWPRRGRATDPEEWQRAGAILVGEGVILPAWSARVAMREGRWGGGGQAGLF